MKHLDAVDGVLAAIPVEDRPASSVIGDSIALLLLKLRMPDAETWIAYTATFAAIRLDEQHLRDYLLISNGLMHRTPCELVLEEETIGCLDNLMLEQLSREEIGLADASTVYTATAKVQHSYTELIHCLTSF